MTELLYGRNAVREALRADRKIMRLMVAEPAPQHAAPPGPPAKRGAPAGRAGKPGAPPARPGRGGKGTPPARPERPGTRPRTIPAPDTRTERRTLLVPGRAPLEEIVNLARAKGVPVEHVPGERLDKLTNGANHQGVAAVAADYHYIAWADLMERIRQAGQQALVLLLDSLQDPQNFGTLLRTAEAVGVTGIILPEHQSVSVTPAVCNASSGAVEYLRIAQVTNMARAVEQLKSDSGLWIYALAGDAEATPIAQADLSGPLGLVVGSEGKGVSSLVRKRCDGSIALPMRGHIGSLNAAVAGSVVLYEVLRQRNASP